MPSTFDKCLKQGKIKKFTPGKRLAKKEIIIAEDDLKSAKRSYLEKNYKWAIIQLYYSMFHSARALLYAQNYREKSHFCLIESIRFLYVEKKLLDCTFIEALFDAKNLREEADYYGDFSKINCEKFLKTAEFFLLKAKELIKL